MNNRGRNRTRLSPLHSKGLLTLCLLLLAESVTFANAKQAESTRSAFSSESSSAGSESFCGTPGGNQAGNDNTCLPTSTAKSKSPFSRIFSIGRAGGGGGGRRRRSVSVGDCCRDCYQFMNNGKHVCDTVPRGGHGGHNHVAEKIVEAAAAAATEGASGTVLPYGIPLNGWKVIFQAFLTTLNVLCWLIPLRSKKISENKLALSLANAFSGGVFLSLAFGHLIPECVHGFTAYNEVTPYLLVLSGYLLIFFVEKVAFDAHDILHEMEHAQDKKHSHGNGAVDSTDTASSGRSAIILLGALAVHSILEMAALGLADKFGDCALLTLSIALHQPAESIALLVAFLKSGMPKDQILLYLSVFSAMGPIGVGVGMAVNEFAAPIVDSIMVAVVAGTFVYVGATEVIPEEWEDSEHKWKKFAALMAGIISILAITQYTATLEL